ncbi:hypothetical protein TEA_000257 [Camellia sinensis var. sinensis]|uniref:Uncharacterized protein n=1 Tax=Camellia sinensis var. sinensis TaxID=542762 RepID=A0A4S4DS69_CAMSN|nr:hypothetical protein TEA_000257 [Camellia sinensis var. sinensis]
MLGSSIQFQNPIPQLPYSSTHRKPTFITQVSKLLFPPLLTCLLHRPTRHSIVCEAAPNKKADSAAKRGSSSKKRRSLQQSSEIRGQDSDEEGILFVLEALDVLRKNPMHNPKKYFAIEQLIAEAYSIIDKAVKVGTLHRTLEQEGSLGLQGERRLLKFTMAGIPLLRLSLPSTY